MEAGWTRAVLSVSGWQHHVGTGWPVVAATGRLSEGARSKADFEVIRSGSRRTVVYVLGDYADQGKAHLGDCQLGEPAGFLSITRFGTDPESRWRLDIRPNVTCFDGRYSRFR